MSLNDFASRYDNFKEQTAKIEKDFVNYGTLKLVISYVKNKNVLNLGLGNGLIAKELSKVVKKQLVLEGSDEIIDRFSFKAKNTKFINTYFEDYTDDSKYNIILANHVIEHVNDPIILLKYISQFLEKDGKIFITVPNANSIHRLIGVEMDLLRNKYQLNSSDIKAGHQRVYDFESLSKDIISAGLAIGDYGGYNIKMVSLAQMKDWPLDLLDAIFTVSKSMPMEICSNIWVLCNKRNQ